MKIKPVLALLISIGCLQLAPQLLGQTNFAMLTTDGAWTRFSDPRAFFNNGTLYFGFDLSPPISDLSMPSDL